MTVGPARMASSALPINVEGLYACPSYDATPRCSRLSCEGRALARPLCSPHPYRMAQLAKTMHPLQCTCTCSTSDAHAVRRSSPVFQALISVVCDQPHSPQPGREGGIVSGQTRHDEGLRVSQWSIIDASLPRCPSCKLGSALTTMTEMLKTISRALLVLAFRSSGKST